MDKSKNKPKDNKVYPGKVIKVEAKAPKARPVIEIRGCPKSEDNHCDSSSEESKCKKFCIDAKLEKFIRHNVKVAQKLVKAFFAGDIQTILGLINANTSLTVVDQTGIIPYAGVTVVGPAAFLQAFQAFNAFVTFLSNNVVDTYVNKNGKSIIIVADVTQINRLAPGSSVTQIFSLRLFFTFEFDKKGRLLSIRIDFETGPLVLFYAQIQPSALTLKK